MKHSSEQDQHAERAIYDDDDEQKTISRQQFQLTRNRLLHAQIQNELLFEFLITAVLCVGFWSLLQARLVLGWALLSIISAGWRALFISERYPNVSLENVRVFGTSYLSATVFSGAVWGSFGAIICFIGNSTDQLFALFALTGITLAAYTSMQSFPKIFAAFVIPAMMPTVACLAYSQDYLNVAYAVFASLFCVLMLMSTRGMHSLLASSIKLSSHNTELIYNLLAARKSNDTAKNLLESANKELQQQIEERRRVEDRIRESKERMQAIFEGMQDTLYQVDKEKIITWATPSIKQLLGYRPNELVGKSARVIHLSDQDFEKHGQALDDSFGRLQHYESMLLHKDGTPVWVSENAMYKYNEVGGITGYEATLRDITALKQTKEALFLAQERAYVTLSSIGDGVIVVNLDGVVEYMNIVAEQGTGWKLEEAHGQQLIDVLKLVDEKTLDAIPDPIQLCLDEARTIMLPGYLLIVHRHLNQRISIEVNASPIRNSDGEISGVVLVFHDVSELRSLAQMTYHATHDSLTGLINRREFEKRVQQALANTRDKDTRHALCYLDLDNFKVVNDTCGHVAGDELLKQLTQTLRSELREGDTLSRIGGDEFGILFCGCSIASAERLAEKIRNMIDHFRFVWDDRSFRIGASIGLVPITDNSGTMSDVLSAADSACYVAKESGRNRIHVYEVNDSALVEQHGQMQWVQRIQEVLEEDRFRLYFQTIAPIDPQLRATEKLHGEVLLRMLDRDERLVGPGSFIPAAERYSLMSTIDRWVVENTLRILARDMDTVIARLNACSINLSGQSLSDERFMKSLVKLIDDTGVPPELLCFEITETAVISNLTSASHLIASLRDMGCRFALDDFGVGLSSFGYLKNLAVDYLKLDGCFIKNMTKDSIDYAMVKAINSVGQTMKIKTIAEFVENEETLAALRSIGVDYAQGYIIAKPSPLEEALYGRVSSAA
ncbi:MAG: EAL domain-containing protein [Thiogranum sp.]|nr:EAL domain-containing protein [Thiogranum sp.]